MRIAYNWIEKNNCARVNRIFITPRAIRESSTGPYEGKERRTNQVGIFIGNIIDTKVFIRALGDVVTSIFVNLIEVLGKMATRSCAESAVTCIRPDSTPNVIDTKIVCIFVLVHVYFYHALSFYTFFWIFSTRATNRMYQIFSIFDSFKNYFYILFFNTIIFFTHIIFFKRLHFQMSNKKT